VVLVVVVGQCFSVDDGDGDVGIVKNHCGYRWGLFSLERGCEDGSLLSETGM
jgi:hypothetical protein